ncbi:MAG TPA: glycosyltransferase family 4 protein [Thermoanaerobaculia bacterium]|jgi:glycosyltransferase involved in cell wall biosynthesis
MRILMFGWEFPPRVSGGLGVACEGLVRGLLELDARVTLVLPFRASAKSARGLRVVSAPSLTERPAKRERGVRLHVRRLRTLLAPYQTEELYLEEWREIAQTRPEEAPLYGPNLPREVIRFSAEAGRIAWRERAGFDVIHAHDWLTYLAGIEARRVTGKPLVLHVHATEYDRTDGEGNPFVSGIERAGLAAADRVVAVSGYTADVVARRYGVPPERLRVVHNAIDARATIPAWSVEEEEPLVLFAGRITSQKGPEYFVEAAARVAAEMPSVKFAVAGSGDRLRAMMERVAALGLSERFLFTGFLPPEQLDRLYARADLYVMPSVSEPFGLTALEALQHGTPVIVSKTAGVGEVVRNVLRVDFGDVEGLASHMLSVLLYPPLSGTLGARGREEVARLSWRESAWRCLTVYRELVGQSEPTSPAP